MSASNEQPTSVTKSIRQVAQRHVITCEPHHSLREATQRMHRHHCSSIVVVDEGCPIGIWTEADALKLDYGRPDYQAMPIRLLMTAPLKTIGLELSLDEAAVEFKRLGIRHLVVVDQQGQLYGILSQSDVVVHQDAESFMRMNEVGGILPSAQPPQLDVGEPIESAVQLMRARHSDSLLVTEQGQPVGLITERDLVRLIAQDRVDDSLAEVMSKPLIAVPDSMSLLAARSLMEKRHIRHLGVNDPQGRLVGLISFADILSSIEHAYVSRLREALARRVADLQQTEQSLYMAHALIDASMDGIMVTDEQGLIQSINPAFTILTGYSEAEALGQSASLISSGKHDGAFYERMWNSIHSTGTWQGEIWNRRKNGEVFPEWLTITRIREPHTGRILFAGIFSDITERKKSEAIIENLAYYDPLTKLPNRQLLFDRLDVAIASAHRDKLGLAVIFVDLDNFKRINDTLGHTVGDRVLCEVADRLQHCVREGDTVARLGGDELILMLTELDDLDLVHRIAQRVFDVLRRSIWVDGQELFVTTSMGGSLYPDDGLTRDDLLKNADTAMYRAKKAGRNQFQLYSAEMNAKSMQRLGMENRLRTALQNNEFFLEYQPKLALDSRQVVGVEALLRWQDKQLGRVPPDAFIPLAEELGLIGDIGAWVLQDACRQCRRWLDAGLPPLQVSVNVSPQQFKRRDLQSDVEQALRQAGLPPQLLELEITESCAIEKLAEVVRCLNQLRAKGVSVSMDDFGTGHSSLSLLTRVPLDKLKIDRSFMNGIPESREDVVLISTIILMAHNLDLTVVAEGVESQAQMDFLAEHGCDQLQGYHFSKPLPADQIETLLTGQPEPA
ncbi:EAL domain-containing protein [Marinobacterium arenosum]|uniref:EAL domain-containing protein n=1 Tax=Marinobacterium arenosum TaxID=2862496 RepID=UPI001C94CCBC|nr:EAL domain-containing protein [Marinobacterium arenosum]MBY4677532.1 EAL domain-containing protein [Marinobacterium arenosum]